jgi:hypothetical protein
MRSAVRAPPSARRDGRRDLGSPPGAYFSAIGSLRFTVPADLASLPLSAFVAANSCVLGDQPNSGWWRHVSIRDVEDRAAT